MGKVTYVVEYEDGKEPPVHAGMDVMGGKLAAVSWSDYRDKFLTTEEVEDIREVVAAGVNTTEHYDRIMRKIEALER